MAEQVPVRIAEDAAARVDELGLRRAMEQMIAHALETASGVRSVEVVLEGDPECPQEPPEVVIWVHRDVPPEGPEADRTNWEWGIWRGQVLKGDACNKLWMHSVYGG